MKVETHNHPTAIAPYPGAATGSGGEIRDEGAVGRGSKPKAGLAGFTTSHLEIPGDRQPWETEFGKPQRIVSALDVMLEGPIGAAAFNNEYGRPALAGYFRTFEAERDATSIWGYHKPVMIAGGLGSIREPHIEAADVPIGAHLIVLGGPAMLIGLGGGAASSMASGESRSDLDFASVQRDNPEMQRRCQEVIDRCVAMGEANPVRLIHDVGAGGLSNALPELVNDARRGGVFDLRAIPNADRGMAPMQIWCNEAQERYVLAIGAEDLTVFDEICSRERCPYAVVGHATQEPHLRVHDAELDGVPVDLPLSTLLGKPPKTHREYTRESREGVALNLTEMSLSDAVDRVLRFPAVGSKKFLVTIGDRSITGLVARDQLVGPHQVPVADAAVTLADFETYAGEAMAMGERSPLAVVDPAASARIAVGEALTNLAGVPVPEIGRIVLSANWMAAAGSPGEDQALHEAVTAVGMELCPALGIAIPVGKDSLSMRTQWSSAGVERSVTSPVTLNVTAFAPVTDVRRVLTPALVRGETQLVLLSLSASERMGASAFAQVFNQIGDATPDIDDPLRLKALFEHVQSLVHDEIALAIHDRSDGGLLVTLLEMAFAGRIGLDIEMAGEWQTALFNEELGVVVQLPSAAAAGVVEDARRNGLNAMVVARSRDDEQINIDCAGTRYTSTRAQLEQLWARTSFIMQRIRDDTQCAEEEYTSIESADYALNCALEFDPAEDVAAPMINTGKRPTIVVLRDQGVNGQIEMAAAFHHAGFEALDVHMSDLFAGRVDLADFHTLVACGGFSYGDVLGGGGGWAKSILFNAAVRDQFQAFFERDSLALGVCNGCQMMSQLRELIPGADLWPAFVRNRSDQFEGRTVQVAVNATEGPWLQGMTGSRISVPVAHGEGRVQFDAGIGVADAIQAQILALQYVDANGAPTQHYPANPNGSEAGVAGLTSVTGKVLIMMPHPERVFRSVQNSYVTRAELAREEGPWMRLFRNARAALG